MKVFCIIYILFISISLQAQNFTGYAIYESKQTFESKLDSTKHSKERIDMIKAMMKKFGEKTFKLSFYKNQSVFVEEEKMEKPGQKGMRISADAGILYKNIKEKRITNQIERFSKQFLIQDSLPVFDWKLEQDTKMIGEYLCFKATTQIEEKKTPRRPRRWEIKENDSLSKTKIVEITAWYTPDIPINNGPKEFSGLPGLILEMQVGKQSLLCTKIVINPKEKIEIIEPKKGKKVNQEEFDKIIEKKTKEMIEMYGGGRKKGERGRRIYIGG